MEATCNALDLRIAFCGQLRSELRKCGLSIAKEARVMARFDVTVEHLLPLISDIERGRAGVIESAETLRARGHLVAASMLLTLLRNRDSRLDEQ